MALNIKSININGIYKQHGYGVPSHISIKGSEFTDLIDFNIYLNTGGNTWKKTDSTSTATTENTFVTGGTFNSSTLTLNRNDGDDIQVTGFTSGGGSSNATNIGDGQSVFSGKSGTTLLFKTVKESEGISVSATNETIIITSVSKFLNDTQIYFNKDTTQTTITLSRDGSALNGQFSVNTLIAVAEGVNNIRVYLQGNVSIIIKELTLSNIYIGGSQVTQVQSTAINELNALFGNSIGQTAPTITSLTTINLTTGGNLNYILTGTNAVAYSYENLPSGVVPVNGNERNLIGGSGLSAGVYTFTARITNYFGETSATITLVVSAAFVNTYSVFGQYSVYYINNVSGQENNTPLHRATMAGTSADAWSVMWWSKVTSLHPSQTSPIFHFGHPSSSTDGKIYAEIINNGSGVALCKLHYGSNNNNLQLVWNTGLNSTTSTNWHCFMLTYTGGDTGTNSGSITNYYDTFKLYVDGSFVARDASTTNVGNGYSGSIIGTTNTFSPLVLMKKGYYNTYGRRLYLDEMAFWDSDRGSDAAVLYNGGNPLNLPALYSPLFKDYYRFGDGPSDISGYPTMSNLGTGPDLTQTNGTVATYKTDVP